MFIIANQFPFRIRRQEWSSPFGKVAKKMADIPIIAHIGGTNCMGKAFFNLPEE